MIPDWFLEPLGAELDALLEWKVTGEQSSATPQVLQARGLDVQAEELAILPGMMKSLVLVLR